MGEIEQFSNYNFLAHQFGPVIL